MKILHTADWHLGRQLYQFSLIEDQQYILNQVLKIAEEEKPDVVLIAGDIYDRSVPSKESVDLFDEFMSKLVIEQKRMVIVIAGNHDCGERLGLHSRILRKQNLHLLGNLGFPLECLKVEDKSGYVNIYAIPFSDPSYYNYLSGEDINNTHQDMYTALLSKFDASLLTKERNILLTHAFVSGGERSESERTIAIGTAELVIPETFTAFNYVALGHLHSSQHVSMEKIRYSGSLLKYSLSEVKHEKSVTIAEIDSDGNTSVRVIQLTPKRDMVRITGHFEDDYFIKECGTNLSRDDFAIVDITNENTVLDAMRMIQELYPYTLTLNWTKKKTEASMNHSLSAEDIKSKTPLHLIEQFYKTMTDKEFDENQKEIMHEVIKLVEGEE